MIYTRETAVANLLLLADHRIYGLTVWDCIRDLPDSDPFSVIQMFAEAWVALGATSFTPLHREDCAIRARPNFTALQTIEMLFQRRAFRA